MTDNPSNSRTVEVMLPCPWCGARCHQDESIEVEEDTYGSRLVCPGCGAAGPRASDDDGEPNELTLWNTRPRDNTALIEALEPSGDTKAAYMGEFSFDVMVPDIDEENDELVPMKVYVPWTTIKEIMAAIRARTALAQTNKTLDKGE